MWMDDLGIFYSLVSNEFLTAAEHIGLGCHHILEIWYVSVKSSVGSECKAKKIIVVAFRSLLQHQMDKEDERHVENKILAQMHPHFHQNRLFLSFMCCDGFDIITLTCYVVSVTCPFIIFIH